MATERKTGADEEDGGSVDEFGHLAKTVVEFVLHDKGERKSLSSFVEMMKGSLSVDGQVSEDRSSKDAKEEVARSVDAVESGSCAGNGALNDEVMEVSKMGEMRAKNVIYHPDINK